MLKRIKNKNAFTLIELIITIAVLGVLVLLAAPKFSGHVQNAELTKGLANSRSIEKASEQYFMDNEDWPRLTDDPYTSEEIESYSERIFNNTGREVSLDPEGNYYDIDYEKLEEYVKVPDNKKNYILQNPVGKVFYMDNLNESGSNRIDYSSNEPEEENFEFAATFTNAGSIGRTGPSQSQLDNAYAGTILEGGIISDNGIQLWTVPESGTYRIETYGAEGGSSIKGVYTGGEGAIIKGAFNLTKGQQIKILTGQYGGSFGGGGGGTFVWENSNTTPLIIAGAGGGAGYSPTVCSGGICGTNGLNATLSNNGLNGTSDNNSNRGSGGTNGSGGLTGSNSQGGAGWISAGARSTYQLSDNARPLDGGLGGLGNSSYSQMFGGFGGGGASYNWSNLTGGPGGGGGGYSGGGGAGGSMYWGAGGGGGSYNSGANQENSVGNTGHGKVIITYLGK